MKNLFLAALGGLLLVLPQISFAKTEGSLCVFKAQTFASLQKNRRESAETVRNELESRKNLLSAAFDCLEEEVGTMRNDLDRTSVKDPAMQAVRKHFIAALEDTMRYYESERGNASNAGLRSAKDIAANLRDWRTNTFLPQQARTKMFITWVNNEEFLATAGRRLEERDRSVQLLKVVDHFDDIQTLLDDASASFHSAQDLHAHARMAFLNGVDPSSPIKLSLEALSKTYSSFIKLSDTINSLLPHGKEK